MEKLASYELGVRSGLVLGILRYTWIRETSTWGLRHASKQWRNENFDFGRRHYRTASPMGAWFSGDGFDGRADACEMALMGVNIVL